MTDSRRNDWFPALAERNIRLYIAGQAVSVLGTWVLEITLNLQLWELIRSPALLGVLNFLPPRAGDGAVSPRREPPDSGQRPGADHAGALDGPCACAGAGRAGAHGSARRAAAAGTGASAMPPGQLLAGSPAERLGVQPALRVLGALLLRSLVPLFVLHWWRLGRLGWCAWRL